MRDWFAWQECGGSFSISSVFPSSATPPHPQPIRLEGEYLAGTQTDDLHATRLRRAWRQNRPNGPTPASSSRVALSHALLCPRHKRGFDDAEPAA